MAAVLDTVLGALAAQLQAAYPVLTFADGERALSEHRTLPGIVWVETSDTFEPPEQRPRTPRRALLRTRVIGLEAHIFAVDRSEVDAVAEELHVALMRVAPGAHDITGGRTVQPDWLTYGRIYVLSFTVRAPIYDAATRMVTLTQVQLTAGTPGDGTLEPGEG